MFINSRMIYISATQRLQSAGPKIEPCGAEKFEKSESICTKWVRFDNPK